jgi:hypothetical protein
MTGHEHTGDPGHGGGKSFDSHVVLDKVNPTSWATEFRRTR